MCGINGIYGLSDELQAKQLLVKMNSSLAHRGPDDEGVFVQPQIALGHRRLSIIDLSSAGHQPMSSYDGRYTIVYNGELYNYRELKFDLQRTSVGDKTSSYFFKTNTDTEVILASFARWGADCLQKFNGMYAFAIWDNQTNELFIARDRMGIKPLYYFHQDGIFSFSSELRALLSTDLIKRKINENALVDYLRYQTVHASETIVDGIKMLMPGEFIKIENSKITIQKYWDVKENISNASEGKSYEAICKDVNNLLQKAVERRLIADVPFGAFLSGGIDSSAVVGLMNKVSNRKVKTFSIVFDDKEFSEAKYSQLIAKNFETEHHEICLKPTDFMNELPNALKAMDHPSGDGPNTYVVSKETKKAGITMALSGLGGDELFAGYGVFQRSLDLNKKTWLQLFPSFLRSGVGEAMKKMKPGVSSDKIAELLKLNNFSFQNTYPLSRQVLMDNQISRLLNRNELPTNRVNEIIFPLQRGTKGDLISQISIAEISTYMQNVLLRDTDQMSMAHALEVRVPFLDYTLVEYVLGVKDKFKNPVTPKKLLVDAMGNMLPKEIVNRPKMGFTLPWKHWMKNELRQMCEQNIVSLSKRNYFNEKEVMNLWNQFLKDNPSVTWSRIWYLVVLENWLKENQVE